MSGAILPRPQYAFMACSVTKKAQAQLHVLSLYTITAWAIYMPGQ
jgi:hypothetical protein